MNISGIRTYAGFYDYNTVKSQEARNQQIAEAKAESVANTVQEEKVQREDLTGEVEQAAVWEKPDLGEKVLSDLQKDQILMQYQVFVGESKVGTESPENHMDERFYL